MMDTTGNSEFVTQFYNLEGDLIPDRKKNFFKLLKAQPVPLTEEDLKDLTPRNYLESLFEIDIFIQFKITTKLLGVIRGGNEVYISKILRHPFLLKDIIGEISPQSFVNEFLPCMSYAMRMKVLTKISFFLDESQMDVIISGVHERYGFDIAKKFLHTCSAQKIKEFLTEYEVILKPRQIKYIFNKNPELLVTYLKHYKKVTGNLYKHNNLCRYFALKNPKFLLRLLKEEVIGVAPLGRRTSKHFIKDAVSDLQVNVKDYARYLKLNIIVQNLRGNFKEVYTGLFPTKKNSLSTTNFCHSLLRHYPKKRQWSLFAETYTSVFEKNILNDLISLNSDFLSFFPNKTIMNSWAELKYNDTKDNDMLQYCHPKKAIPLIKEKINVMSDISQRTKLLLLLVKTCAKNADLTTLEEVLKYVSIRHRNEDATHQVLDQVKHCFKLEELNETHWTYVNEIIAFLKIKRRWYCYDACIYGPKYMEFLISHGKPIKNEVATFIKDIEGFGGNFDFDLNNPAVQRQIWTEIFNMYPAALFSLYPAAKEANEKAFTNRAEQFINILISFNERNPDHTMDLLKFPHLAEYVTSLLGDDFMQLSNSKKRVLQKVLTYNFKFPDKPAIPVENATLLRIFRVSEFWFEDSMARIVKKKNRSEFENEVLQLFWDSLMGCYQLRVHIVPWLLSNEPRTLLPYFDRLLAIDPKCVNLKVARLMSHLGFDSKIKNFTAGKLKSLDELTAKIEKGIADRGDMEVDGEVKEKIDVHFYFIIIDVLSELLSTKEYIEIVVQRFLPEKKKMDAGQDELRDFYMLQRRVAESFKKMHEAGEALPAVMQFCAGDYLQSALPSLYSVCYRAPENLLYAYMERLSKGAVSVRKHALFLSCELLTYDYALSMLKNPNETNVSSLKHVFSSTLKFWRKNPNDELLSQVISNLYVIDKNDTETLESLIKIKVPEKYVQTFKEKCWYFFEDLRTKDVDVQNYLESFLKSFMSSSIVLKSLPIKFCKHIITQYFKDKPARDYSLSSINRFVCLFLRLKTEQVDNFKFVFDIVSLFKNNNSTAVISKFFNEFYLIAQKDIKENSKIDKDNNYYIELFKQNWNRIFTPVEMFDEHIFINLLYLSSKSCGVIENYAKEVVNYFEQLVAQYGPYIYSKFKDLLLAKDNFTQKERYLFFYNMLQFKNSTPNCILVIDLMAKYSSDDEIKDIRQNIIKMLKGSNDPVVAIYFNKAFRNDA